MKCLFTKCQDGCLGHVLSVAVKSPEVYGGAGVASIVGRMPDQNDYIKALDYGYGGMALHHSFAGTNYDIDSTEFVNVNRDRRSKDWRVVFGRLPVDS